MQIQDRQRAFLACSTATGKAGLATITRLIKRGGVSLGANDKSMAIPDFQSVMFPLVKILGDGQERTMRQVTDLLAESFQLTDQEREELLPSGQQSIIQQPGSVGEITPEGGGTA